MNVYDELLKVKDKSLRSGVVKDVILKINEKHQITEIGDYLLIEIKEQDVLFDDLYDGNIFCLITNYKTMSLILIERFFDDTSRIRCKSFLCDREIVEYVRNYDCQNSYDKILAICNKKQLTAIKSMTFNDYLPRTTKSSRYNI